MTESRPGFVVVLCIFLALRGWATAEVLLPHSSVAPPGVDFSGTWQINERESADQQSINRAVTQTDGVKNSSTGGQSRQSNARQARSSRNRGALVDVFLRTGRTLQITQTPYGFFVSVDRSVVEEFRFGESRMISVGEIEVQRASGWDGASYVVETLDKNGNKMIQRFWLSEDENVLHREITFRGRGDESATVVQFFGRETKP